VHCPVRGLEPVGSGGLKPLHMSRALHPVAASAEKCADSARVSAEMLARREFPR